jgi:LDH2 family malate/lactate/ureidoglycolate dehydrogenase
MNHLSWISFEEMKAAIKKSFVNAGIPEEKADTCVQIHTESSGDGINSHGLNRVEQFVDFIKIEEAGQTTCFFYSYFQVLNKSELIQFNLFKFRN